MRSSRQPRCRAPLARAALIRPASAGLPLCLALAAMLIVPACEPPQPNNEQELRLISFAPHLTQMLIELGLEQTLVGQAEHDAAAPDHLPGVGHFQDVDSEALLALRPTHVLLSTSGARAPARLDQLAETAGFELLVWDYPQSIDEVLASLVDTQPALGPAFGLEEEAAALRDRVRRRLDELRDLAEHAEPIETLLVIGSRPLMASGPGSVHHELLAYAGARNAARHRRSAQPTFDREELLDAAPEAIVLLRPGGPQPDLDDHALRDLVGLDIPAVRGRRLHALTHPHGLLPTTTLPQLAAELLARLHPQLAGELPLWAEAPDSN